MGVFQKQHQQAIRDGVCPVCGAEIVENGDMGIGSDNADMANIVMVVECNECDSKWRETYSLEDVTILKVEGKEI